MKVNTYTINNETFWRGAKVSNYGLQNGYIDYRCLKNAMGDCVLNNNIINLIDEFEIVHGSIYDEEYDEYIEVFQWYIIDDNGFDILQNFTDEIVYYSEELDMYIWGVTHVGTGWDYVLTDIKINKEEK